MLSQIIEFVLGLSFVVLFVLGRMRLRNSTDLKPPLLSFRRQIRAS